MESVTEDNVDERIMEIANAMSNIDFDDNSNLTDAGRPRVDVMEDEMGADLTMEEVDEAFIVYRSFNEPVQSPEEDD